MGSYIKLDINKITENFDDFALAKMDIENFWLANKTISEKHDLIGFVNKLNLYENIYVGNETDVLPFKHIKTKTNSYLFYCSTMDLDKTTRYLNNIIHILDKQDENKIKLTEVSNRFLLENSKAHPDYPYLIIKQKNYSIEEYF